MRKDILEKIFNRYTLLFTVIPILPLLASERASNIEKIVEQATAEVLTYGQMGKRLNKATGFFIKDDSTLVTNWHVLEGVCYAKIQTFDNKLRKIKGIVAENKESDIIVVSVDIPSAKVQPLTLSNSLPQIGDSIVMIAYTIAYGRQITYGIVKEIHETIECGTVIEITAPIIPGASGSPVVNLNGQVVAIATYRKVIDGEWCYYAMPVTEIQEIKRDSQISFAEWHAGCADDHFFAAKDYYEDGVNLTFKSDYNTALLFFEKALREFPDYAECYVEIGICNERLKRHKQAVKAYKKAIQIQQDCVVAYNGLGIAHYNLGSYREALEAYKKVLELEPSYPETYYNLGNIYLELGKYNDAVEKFEYFLTIQPDRTEAHFALASAYVNLQRFEDAISRFNQVIFLKPDLPEAYYNTGVCYGNLGYYEKEIKAYSKAIALRPDYAEAHYNLAIVYIIRGDKTSALEQYYILKDLNKDLASALRRKIEKD